MADSEYYTPGWENGITGWAVPAASGPNNTCVKVGRTADGDWAVGDTKDASRPPLRYSGAEWAAFVQSVKDGQFDPEV